MTDWITDRDPDLENGSEQDVLLVTIEMPPIGRVVRPAVFNGPPGVWTVYEDEGYAMTPMGLYGKHVIAWAKMPEPYDD